MSAALNAREAAADGPELTSTTRPVFLIILEDLVPGPTVSMSSCVRVLDASKSGLVGVPTRTRLQVGETFASEMIMNLLSNVEESDGVPVAPSGAPSPLSADLDERSKSIT